MSVMGIGNGLNGGEAGLGQTLVHLVQAVHRPGASQAEFNSLASCFEQVKQTPNAVDVVQLGFQLASDTSPVEVRLAGFQLLEHAVFVRWTELSEQQQTFFFTSAWESLQSGSGNAEPWAVSNKKAFLVALVTKHSKPWLWDQLLPQLLQLATQGPVQAVKACLVLRMVTEEVSWTHLPVSKAFQSHLQEWKREMLAKYMASLDTVLPFLHDCLERYFMDAVQSNAAAQVNPAAQAVQASLEAIGEYADWAPVSRMAQAKLIQACGWLCTTPEFRLPALAVLRRIFDRKLQHEEQDGYHAAMREVGHALLMSAHSVLKPEFRNQIEEGEPLEETAMHISTSLGLFGYRHITALAPEQVTHFLDANMEFVKCKDLRLMHSAIALWVTLLGTTERSRHGLTQEFMAPDAYTIAVMRIAGSRLRDVQTPAKDADVPMAFQGFEDYYRFVLEVRNTLIEVIRLSSSILPDQALQEATEQLAVLRTQSEAMNSQEGISQDLFAACIFMETVVGGVSESFLPGGRKLKRSPDPSTVNTILDCLENLFRDLVKIRIRQAALAAAVAPVMEAMKTLVTLRKHTAAIAIEKIFDVLGNDLPIEGGATNLPATLPPGWKQLQQSRFALLAVLIVFAKHGPESMRSHVQALAAKSEEYWQKGAISPGERAKLCELMLTSVSTADLAFQQEVVSYVLKGIQDEWTSEAWQNSLSSLEAWGIKFFPVQESASGTEVGGGLARWMLCHHIFVLEKAVTRLPWSGSAVGEHAESPGSPSWHLFNPSLPWMMPVLFRLLELLQELYTPRGAALLKGASSALQIGAKERAVYLNQLYTSKGNNQIAEEEEATVAGSTASCLRHWLRQMREGVYMILEKFIRHVGGFYVQPLHTQFVDAVCSQLESTGNNHLRLLLRRVIMAMVAACPLQHRAHWLLPCLQRLIPHIQIRLETSWSSVFSRSSEAAGAAAAQGLKTREDAKSANDEIVEEQFLRDLTNEHLVFLRYLLGPKDEVPREQPVIDQLWQVAPEVAKCACATAISALWIPDVVVSRASAFLRVVISRMDRKGLEDGSGAQMLRGALQAVTTGVLFDSEPMGLVRDLLVFNPPLPGTFEVLLEMPKLTADSLKQLKQELDATNSAHDQRLIIRNVLAASGHEKLEKALIEWRVPSKLANVTEQKPRNGINGNRLPAHETDGLIGLAQL